MTPERWRQIEEIFQAAVERAPEERAAFLDQACAGDPELRQEVESLLAQEDSQETILTAAISAAAESLSATHSDDMIGRRIGVYRVTGLIGQGGMAEVFQAVRDDDQYQKQVAIKLVKRGMITGFTLSRFRYERQILATLEHPHIARLLDGGTTEEGLPYFVMEYIEGQPITQYCENQRLSTRERLKLFRQVCAAVQHAHRNLIVHRDLKPSNILVTKDGMPKLLDFGIAKLLNPELTPETMAQTATAMRMMTPDYASPEQVRGEPVTTATDVYSLGAVLYELLTEQRPHQFTNLSFSEIERVICEQEPEKPSVTVSRKVSLVPGPWPRTRDKLRKQLAGDLDNIVLMAMRKEPERRYQSVEQFSEDIRRHLEGLPVQARPDTLVYRASKFAHRHKAGVGFAAVLLVLLIGFAVMMSIQAARIAEERDRANQVAAFLVELFGVADSDAARGDTITVREILDKGAERINREFKDQPEVQAALMDRIGRVYQSLGLYESATPLLEGALEIRRQTLGQDHPDVAENLHNLAVALHAKGDFQAAEPWYRDALALRRKLFGQAHRDVAVTLNGLALLLYHKGEYDEAEVVYRQALAMRRGLFGENHPDVAESLSGLALVMFLKGQHDEAEALNRQALALRRKLLGENSPSVATSLSNLASVLRAKSEYDEAEALYREALAIRRKRLPEGHPHIAYSLVGLGEILTDRGNPQEAEPLLREGLAIRLKALSKDHWLTAHAKNALGGCLTELQRYNEAEPLLLESISIMKAHHGEQSEQTRQAVSRLIKLYEAWGKPEKAARYRAVLSSVGRETQDQRPKTERGLESCVLRPES
jgi:serine/threonine-protein kinase